VSIGLMSSRAGFGYRQLRLHHGPRSLAPGTGMPSGSPQSSPPREDSGDAELCTYASDQQHHTHRKTIACLKDMQLLRSCPCQLWLFKLEHGGREGPRLAPHRDSPPARATLSASVQGQPRAGDCRLLERVASRPNRDGIVGCTEVPGLPIGNTGRPLFGESTARSGRSSRTGSSPVTLDA